MERCTTNKYPQHEIRSRTSERWFITGATGFIGRELIRYLMDKNQKDIRITVLVRSGGTTSAEDRFSTAMKGLLSANQIECIKILTGSITEKYFGLDPVTWANLTRTNNIVHLAALTRFDADLDTARGVNVSGVKNVVELAKKAHSSGCLKHWAHVSTAYVVGDRTDKVSPGELGIGNRYRNTYEQSKNEAEQLLQPFLAKYPLTIFRPSIVVGHSKSGEAGNNNTVYWGIRSYLSGQTKVFGNANTPLDLVPVDYVVYAIVKLMRDRRAEGKTLTLAGGDKTTVSLYQFIDQICRYLDSPLPEIVSPNKLKRMKALLALVKLSRRHKQFIEQAESYLPYFSQNPSFDTSETESLLWETEIRVPQLHEYLDNILNYCLNQSWGMRSKIVGAGYQQIKTANGW